MWNKQANTAIFGPLQGDYRVICKYINQPTQQCAFFTQQDWTFFSLTHCCRIFKTCEPYVCWCVCLAKNVNEWKGQLCKSFYILYVHIYSNAAIFSVHSVIQYAVVDIIWSFALHVFYRWKKIMGTWEKKKIKSKFWFWIQNFFLIFFPSDFNLLRLMILMYCPVYMYLGLCSVLVLWVVLLVESSPD